MKKLFLFLVAIVFVLVSYGFSEARKYKVVCEYFISVTEKKIEVRMYSMRGVNAKNVAEEGS
ncbi:MAG: hypothetical protein ACJZ47_00470 [bacterium]